jgi:7-cyano-7-deazaguanine synthase in queuosine biosynthesis
MHGPQRNVRFEFKSLEQTIGRGLKPLVKDLLEIAVAVFISDQCYPNNRYQFRKICIQVPVRKPSAWKRASDKLTQTIDFLTGDWYDFRFVRIKEGLSTAMPVEKPSPELHYSCVALLSGGLDSYSGAKSLAENGEHPLFVSHCAGGKSHGSQKKLVEHLQSKFKKQFTHCRVSVTRFNTEHSIMRLRSPSGRLAVQFSRSFLFLSLATALAVELGIRRIYIFENGPIAINAAISESRINTKTAHPRFLQLYRELVRLVFGIDIEIVNPYLYKTKSQVVETLLSRQFRSSIKIATSCWQTSKVQLRAVEKGLPKGVFKGHHCGVCFPCILRRVSLASLHLPAKYDDAYSYSTARYDGRYNSSLKAIQMFTRILTDLERSQAKAYVKQDGERTLNIKILTVRARK